MLRIRRIDPEGWYDIPGYGGRYQINYYGNIRRVLKNGRCKDLHPFIKKTNGRRCVKLNSREEVVLKLMQRTFIGELPEGIVAYHKNGILADDCLGNIGTATRERLGKMTGTWNECELAVAKISPDGEIVAFYKSAREAGRMNYMSYQTILDRVNGKVKSLYAPDGYVYVADRDRDIQKAIRRIEMDNQKECGVAFVKAPEVVFDF